MNGSHNLVQVKFAKHILEEAGIVGEAPLDELVPDTA